MGLSASLVVLALLIACSAFFSVAEISLAAARRVRLRQMAADGDARAERVAEVQRQPGDYFTVIQIGQNMVAILGGIAGEAALTPHVARGVRLLGLEGAADTLGFVLAFLIVTSLFILFSDLFPKRLGMAEPERIAVRVVTPMLWWTRLLHPMVWLFSGLAALLFRVFGLPQQRDDRITQADIVALAAAGAEAGVLHAQEQQVIENLFEMETRTVETSMTARDHIVFFLQDEDEAIIRARIAAEPHSTYLVCDKSIDNVAGYVDAADLFARVLREEPIVLKGEGAKGLLQKALLVPDRLTLSEMLVQFRQAHEDFAVIVNEYSLVVGVITLNDVMSTVMGSLVAPDDESQIVRREDGSWLMDGLTPVVEVMRAIDADPAELPQRGQYDTLAGFLMVMLRRIPRRTDAFVWNGYRFEVLDVDSSRIDQVMVMRVQAPVGLALESAA
ncbi:MAG: HlyC/CorC family transporter [Comamonadaceae bacterium]|nr:MAG: HlyC/CorC family transporter [Comamonadaceae bacterium]